MPNSTPPPPRSCALYYWLAVLAVPLTWVGLLGIERMNNAIGLTPPPASERQAEVQPDPAPPPPKPWSAPEPVSQDLLTDTNIQAAHTMSLMFPAHSDEFLQVLHTSESFVVTSDNGTPTRFYTSDGAALHGHPWPAGRPQPIAARIDMHGYTGAPPQSIRYLVEHTGASANPARPLAIVFGEPLLMRLLAAAADESAPPTMAVLPAAHPPGFRLAAAH